MENSVPLGPVDKVTIRDAGGALVQAMAMHVDAIQNERSVADVLRICQQLEDALGHYKSVVVNTAGWGVPIESVPPRRAREGVDEPLKKGDKRKERKARRAAQTRGKAEHEHIITVRATYPLRVTDQYAVEELARKRRHVTGHGGCDDDEPGDPLAAVMSIFVSDGWDPFRYEPDEGLDVLPYSFNVEYD